MESTELYQRILGLSGPWKVTDVELDVAGRSVSIEVVHDPHEAACCPECGRACPGYDSIRRSWRHLDTCQMQTILSAEIPRANCPEHGIHQVRIPWAEAGSRFTALFEWVVIGWLKVAPIKAVADLMGLSWDQVDGIRHRGVARGLARRKLEAPKRVGVDETSSKRGREYFTVMTDIDRSIVLHVADGRNGESLGECLGLLTKEQVAGIDVVAMDMSGAYLSALRKAVPDAESKIAFDKFHVAAAATLKTHLFGVFNAIRTGMTNAISESMNSKIQWIKRKACGFRNLDRFRDAIYFHLGGLDMRPTSLTHTNA